MKYPAQPTLDTQFVLSSFSKVASLKAFKASSLTILTFF